MSTVIHRSGDRRIVFLIESTPGFPAISMIRAALGGDQVHVHPIEWLDSAPPAGDCVVVARAGGAQVALLRRAGLKPPRLIPGAYHVAPTRLHGRTGRALPGRALAVLGGDLFGMLAGLAEVLRHGELSADAWTYRGDARTETPALPLRYYWTWDHSTNWTLDDPGNQSGGCSNPYLKRPETFVNDYKQVIDHCVRMRFNGLVVWGFLRDAHGGETSALEIARYAAERGVALMPGVGTTGYGGVYYRGRHPCNLETFLTSNRDLGNMSAAGVRSGGEMSPYHPRAQDYIRQSVTWLHENFPIGGMNLENMDLLVDHSPAGRRARARLKTREADHYKDQYVAYLAALDVADRLAPGNWNCYATYTGFNAQEMKVVPGYVNKMPASAVAQWTLSSMVLDNPVPLQDWMKNPRPRQLEENPKWPMGLRPPTPRSAGFLHQASPWCPTRRNACMISTFAEGCVRAQGEGLEGISIHGETSNRSLAYDLNYLTMRHWTYHPKSTLEEFAVAELTGRVGDAEAALIYVRALAALQAGDQWDPLESTCRHASLSIL